MELAFIVTANLCISGIACDMTEIRNIGYDIIRDEKLKSVGRLAGGIAHDFNNLLAIIQGNIELTKYKINDKEQIHNYLDAAEFAVEQAAELTKRLIIFSSGGMPFKKKCDIRKIVIGTIGNCLTGKSVEKKYSLDNDLWLVEIDEGQIREVFRNIGLNASEAMPEGGLIKVQARNLFVKHDEPLPLSEGFYICISVEDSGTGIEENKLPLIFDPYYSTKQRGTEKGMGLGLSICHSIINKHNGCITVKSKKDYGSTFNIYLPAFTNKEM